MRLPDPPYECEYCTKRVETLSSRWPSNTIYIDYGDGSCSVFCSVTCLDLDCSLYIRDMAESILTDLEADMALDLERARWQE